MIVAAAIILVVAGGAMLVYRGINYVVKPYTWSIREEVNTLTQQSRFQVICSDGSAIVGRFSRAEAEALVEENNIACAWVQK